MDCWQSYNKGFTEPYSIVDRACEKLFPKHSFVYLQKQSLVYLQKHSFVKRIFFSNVGQSKRQRVNELHKRCSADAYWIVDRDIIYCWESCNRLLTELWETVRLHETKFFLRARINCWRSYIDCWQSYIWNCLMACVYFSRMSDNPSNSASTSCPRGVRGCIGAMLDWWRSYNRLLTEP
jgi:hypothetical protein